MKNEQKFYSALEDIFIGEAGLKIEGKSGYVNLMKLKSQYFAHIKPFIEKEVNDTFNFDIAAREEAFQKLYTFFESYLNDTGTPFLSQTPFHKNLYEKVYSEREDVSLFWKTQRLYYVKSEATYQSIQNLVVDNLIFNFDASQIEHQKSNEKRNLEFWVTKLTNDSVTFKVVYENNSKGKWERLKNYLKLDKPDEIRKYLSENFNDKTNSKIIYKDNGFIHGGLKAKQKQNALLITNNDDLTSTVTVEFAINNIDDIKDCARYNNLPNLTERETTFKRAQHIYKKQNEVDYFIHKDAESFLKEQLDMFLFQYIFGDNNINNEWNQERISTIQKLKRIAHKIIIYIARFEDELKHVWEKKKIVKQVNCVFTLDRLFPINKSGDRDFNNPDSLKLLNLIISNRGFVEQKKEWKSLSEFEREGRDGKIIKEKIKELILPDNIDSEILVKKGNDIKFNSKYKNLPIDTIFFPEIKIHIFSFFNNIDKILDGILIKSDNWHALNTIYPKYQNSIQTIYSDPPFNVGENGDYLYKVNYKDSTWITILENRLELAKKLLKESGNIFINSDDHGNMYLRTILDKIMGQDNYKNEIIWAYEKPGGAENKLKNNHSNIYFYSKNINKAIYNTIFVPRKNELNKNRFEAENHEEGKKSSDYWDDIPSFATSMTDSQRTTKMLGKSFKTQQPEKLYYRILQISNNKNEENIILDFFGGSGVIATVGLKTKNKWICIEMGEQMKEIILPRIKLTLSGFKFGINKQKDFKEEIFYDGGGLIKYYELEQYEECLARAAYNPKIINENGEIEDLEQLAYYTFSNSEKLLSAMLIDEENEEVKIHFQTLYPEMDEAAIAETISNVSGKRIKILNKERVEFEDGNIIEFAKMKYDDHVFCEHYRSLLWWKSKSKLS